MGRESSFEIQDVMSESNRRILLIFVIVLGPLSLMIPMIWVRSVISFEAKIAISLLQVGVDFLAFYLIKADEKMIANEADRRARQAWERMVHKRKNHRVDRTSTVNRSFF